MMIISLCGVRHTRDTSIPLVKLIYCCEGHLRPPVVGTNHKTQPGDTCSLSSYYTATASGKIFNVRVPISICMVSPFLKGLKKKRKKKICALTFRRDADSGTELVEVANSS